MTAPNPETRPEIRPEIRVVCFDLGGVVVRIARSWAEACAAAAIEERNPEQFAAPDMQSGRRELSDGYQLGDIDCDAYFELIARSSGGLYEPREVEAVHRAWIFEPYEGVPELIDRLNATGTIRTACLSNTNHSHWQHLQHAVDGRPRVPAIHRLHTRLVSHELGAVKPDAKIYELAEQRLHARGPEIVFFDDLEENVLAAQERGWLAHHIDHAAEPAEQMARYLGAHGVL